MKKSKQRRISALQPQVGTAKLLGPAWITASDDPEYAWEVPRHSVEIRVKDCIANALEQNGGLESYYVLVIQDALGRAYVSIGLVAARRLVIIAVPAQDEHGRLWATESLAYGDFALKVRRSSNGRAVGLYYDNAAQRAENAKYDTLLQDAMSRPLDGRPINKAESLQIAHQLSDGLTAKGFAPDVCAVHVFLPDEYVQ